jgi:hypothetical protein
MYKCAADVAAIDQQHRSTEMKEPVVDLKPIFGHDSKYSCNYSPKDEPVQWSK